MKKIKRLSLSGLEKESIKLSVQEQMSIYAGSGIDGLCYFEGLEILSKFVGCNYSESYYINSYAATHGGYSSIMTASGQLLGVDATNANSYLTTQFSASAASLNNYQALLTSGNEILTTMNISAGVAHAIVITGYDSATGKYIYSDANGTGQEISASQLNSALSMAVSSGIPH